MHTPPDPKPPADRYCAAYPTKAQKPAGRLIYCNKKMPPYHSSSFKFGEALSRSASCYHTPQRQNPQKKHCHAARFNLNTSFDPHAHAQSLSQLVPSQNCSERATSNLPACTPHNIAKRFFPSVIKHTTRSSAFGMRGDDHTMGGHTSFCHAMLQVVPQNCH